MHKFKDDKNLLAMYFVKARCEGQVVRMYASADVDDTFAKVREYQKQNFAVWLSLKPVKVITSDGYTFKRSSDEFACELN